jgi:hypothetical protein
MAPTVGGRIGLVTRPIAKELLDRTPRKHEKLLYFYGAKLATQADFSMPKRLPALCVDCRHALHRPPTARIAALRFDDRGLNLLKVAG